VCQNDDATTLKIRFSCVGEKMELDKANITLWRGELDMWFHRVWHFKGKISHSIDPNGCIPQKKVIFLIENLKWS
jgi:hypothetical protein